MALSDTDEIHLLSAGGTESIFCLPSSALRNHVFFRHMCECEFESANQSNVEKHIENVYTIQGVSLLVVIPKMTGF